MTDLLDHGGVAFLAGHDERGIAGQELLQREDQDRHEEQCRHQLGDAAREEVQHEMGDGGCIASPLMSDEARLRAKADAGEGQGGG